MPLYDYTCQNGHTSEHFRLVAQRHECPQCPTCGKPTTKNITAGKAEMEYTERMGESRSYFISKGEVAKARRMFRHGSIKDDGRVIFRNRKDAQGFAREWSSMQT